MNECICGWGTGLRAILTLELKKERGYANFGGQFED